MHEAGEGSLGHATEKSGGSGRVFGGGNFEMSVRTQQPRRKTEALKRDPGRGKQATSAFGASVKKDAFAQKGKKTKRDVEPVGKGGTWCPVETKWKNEKNSDRWVSKRGWMKNKSCREKTKKDD